MEIKAIAPWFGGKRTLAPDIVKLLGDHTQYFEPFCGSMSVLFAKEPSQKETVCDLHGGLICLARVLADDFAAPDLYNRLQRTLFSEDLLYLARAYFDELGGESNPPWWLRDSKKGEEPSPVCFCPSCTDIVVGYDSCPKCGGPCQVEYGRRVDSNMIEFAYWYFIGSWMARNGTAGTERRDYQIAVRWTNSGGSPTTRFKNATESIPAWHERLKNVVILNRDAFQFLDKFEDDSRTAMYVDSPYTWETRADGNGAGGRYLFDFPASKKREGSPSLFGGEPEEDLHDVLARTLRAYNHARIVVSYYDCPRVRSLYEGWRFIDKHRQKHLHAQAGRGARKLDAPEVLIVNDGVTDD